jgi:hypothetical protein
VKKRQAFSITGDIVYNLALSQRRADWVKRTLVSRGIPENRIVGAAGWGELYPVCAEDTQECQDRNKLVRLIYCPTGAASPYEREGVAGSHRRNATQSDRAGNLDAFALDQSLAQRAGA